MNNSDNIFDRALIAGKSITEALKAEQAARVNNFRAVEERISRLEAQLQQARLSVLWIDRRKGQRRKSTTAYRLGITGHLGRGRRKAQPD